MSLKIKKACIYVLLLILVAILIGCAVGVKSNLRNYNDFMTCFNDKISGVSEASILQLSDVSLEDGIVAHVFRIKYPPLDGVYRLQINTNKYSEIVWIDLTADWEVDSRDFQFAVFAFYVYESMGFPEIDANDFYEKYDLFSKESIFESETCGGYQISSMTVDVTNEIIFSISESNEK